MSATAQSLELQTQRGFRTLRFAPELERQFLAEHAKIALVQRLILLVMGAVLVACAPLFDSLLLNPPAEYVPVARRVQFGVILPALLLAFAFTADPRLRRWADAVGIVTLMVVVGAWEYLRHVGVQHDFEVPVVMIGVLLAGTFALAGAFFWALAPVAVLGLVFFSTVEILTRGATDETLYNILALFLLAFVTAMSRYVQEYYQRVHWLERLQTHPPARGVADAGASAGGMRDPLTGLANRRRQDEALRQAFERSGASRCRVALLCFDLDNFKSINEALGHSAGDRFLIEAAERLQRLVPKDALVCRHGGDEFSVVIENLDPDTLEPTLREIGATLVKGLGEPYVSTGDYVHLTASLGIAVHPRDGEEVEQIVASAEAAMYLAKRKGRNTLQFAEAALTDDTRRNVLLASQIRRGIVAQEFEPHYQPIVDVRTGQVIGVEALLRWHHPSRGLVLPDEFIRIAEDTSLIVDLGGVTLRRAFAQAAAWAKARRISVEINLSARQLDDGNLVSLLAELQKQSGLSPDAIGFEITETAMMLNPEESQRTLQLLRQLGYRLSIDDFGTGFSALGYLQKFPVHRIKIDRSFVARLGNSRQAPAIIAATIALGESLGLEVVAEGVETSAQMTQMRDLGCTLQQGYYFARAMPPDELERWLAQPVRALAVATN